MLEKTFEANQAVNHVVINAVRVDQLSLYANRGDFVKARVVGEVEDFGDYYKNDKYVLGYPDGISFTIGGHNHNQRRIHQFELYLPEGFAGSLTINCAMGKVQLNDPLQLVAFNINAASIEVIGSRLTTRLKIAAASANVNLKDVEGEIVLNGADNSLSFVAKENSPLEVRMNGANSHVTFLNDHQHGYSVDLKGISSLFKDRETTLRRSTIQRHRIIEGQPIVRIKAAGVNQSVTIY